MRMKIIIFLIILLVLSSLNVLAVSSEDCDAGCRTSIQLEVPNPAGNPPSKEMCYIYRGSVGSTPFMLYDCDPSYYDTGIQTRTCGSVNGVTGCYDCFLADGQPNPKLKELCDGVDNDCDGEVDEGQACDKCPPVAESGLLFPSESSSGMEANVFEEVLDQLKNQNQQSLSDSDRSYARNFLDYFAEEFGRGFRNPSYAFESAFEHSETLGWTVGGLYYGGMALAAPAVAEVAAFYAPKIIVAGSAAVASVLGRPHTVSKIGTVLVEFITPGPGPCPTYGLNLGFPPPKPGSLRVFRIIDSKMQDPKDLMKRGIIPQGLQEINKLSALYNFWRRTGSLPTKKNIFRYQQEASFPESLATSTTLNPHLIQWGDKVLVIDLPLGQLSKTAAFAPLDPLEKATGYVTINGMTFPLNYEAELTALRILPEWIRGYVSKKYLPPIPIY